MSYNMMREAFNRAHQQKQHQQQIEREGVILRIKSPAKIKEMILNADVEIAEQRGIIVDTLRRTYKAEGYDAVIEINDCGKIEVKSVEKVGEGHLDASPRQAIQREFTRARRALRGMLRNRDLLVNNLKEVQANA